MKICSIDGCGGVVLALGWCQKHYLRHYKHGDANFVKSPTDYVLKGKASPNYKHGLWDHPLYKTWNGMMRRCYDPREPAFKNYGAKGIDVCLPWHDLQTFIDDMGSRQDGLSVDRIDGEKGYSPENCRWANRNTQTRNRRVTKLSFEKAEEIRQMKIDGFTRQQMADKYGVAVASVKKILGGAYWNAPD